MAKQTRIFGCGGIQIPEPGYSGEDHFPPWKYASNGIFASSWNTFRASRYVDLGVRSSASRPNSVKNLGSMADRLVSSDSALLLPDVVACRIWIWN